MTYRFTATEKQEDAWYRQLSLEAKVLFEFLRDKCDYAGFWEIDLQIASFYTGISLEDKNQFDSMRPTRSLQGAMKELEKSYLTDGRYVWLRNFLYHQKNLPLNPENKLHKGILGRIKSHNSFGNEVLRDIDEQLKRRGLQGACKGLVSPTGIGKGKGKGKKRGMGGNKSFSLDEVKDACFKQELSDADAELLHATYTKKAKNGCWVDGNGIPITDLTACVTQWRLRKPEFDKAGNKAKINPNCCYHCGHDNYDSYSGRHHPMRWIEGKPFKNTDHYNDWVKKGRPEK